MGFIRLVVESTLITSVLLLFVAYSPLFLDCNPLPSTVKLLKNLDGGLKVNDHLNKAEKLFEGRVQWPESLAVKDGVIFTGVHDGSILKIDGNKVTTLLRTGENCEGQWEEPKCGRPLGMRFGKDGHLYVVDAYYGMFKVNVEKGTKELILSSSAKADGKSLMFMNDLVISEDKDNIIYFTQSSTRWNLTEIIYSIIEHDSTGRVLSFNSKTKEVRVLAEGLRIANGIEMSPNGKRLLIAECAGHQILQYDLEGAYKGKLSAFSGDLPGEVDNIRRSPRGGYWVGLNSARTENNPTLTDRLGKHIMARKVLMRLLHITGKLLTFAAEYIPSPAVKEVAFNALSARFIADVLPAHGTIVLLNEKGVVVESMHSPDGQVAHISEVLEHDGHLYLGSWRNKFLARVQL